MSSHKNKSRPRRAGSPSPAKPLSRGKLWLFRITLLLLPFVLLTALEIALRLGGYGFDPHFFKRLSIDGRDWYVQNDNFSFRFFPRDNARNPDALRMSAVKPPGTIRIFIFGESAAMGDPEPAYGPVRYLETQLQARFPGTQFEIVNTAFTAINSHVILPIARECAQHDGDLWIIYMGNNEMVGPYGAATVFGRRSPPLPYVRFLTAAQATRVGQLCASLARRLHRHGENPGSWGGMEMFLQNQIAPDDPLRENVYRNFQVNLHDIVSAGLGSGAKILLNTVAVNLRDCPPFASLHPAALSPGDLAQFDQFFTNAVSAAAQNNPLTAEYSFAQAARVDNTFAALQYQWGRTSLAQTNLPAARDHLQSACDNDALPFRTDSRLNNLIRSEAQKHPDPNLVLFDAAAALADSNADHLCGNETFYEHVHFDFDGAYRLGLAWAQQVAKMFPSLPTAPGGWLGQSECDRRLGLSAWNRVAVYQSMMNRLGVPPFSSQDGNSVRVAELQAEIDRLHAGMTPAAAASTRANFLEQINHRPDDFLLLANFALFLQAAGDLPGAIDQWRHVRELVPQDYVSLFQLGHLLELTGQWPDAEQDLRASLALHHSFPEGWFELANTLASREKYPEALAAYALAHEQRPEDSRPLLRSGKIHALQNQHAEAMACYQQAAKLDPSAWEPPFLLGGELDAAGRFVEARDEFALAVRLNPGSSRTHFNYGVLLAKLGQLAAARTEFAESLRLEPDYQNARQALARVQQLLQQTSHH